MKLLKKTLRYYAEYWQGLSLNKKFTIVILAVLVIPVLMASLIVFSKIEDEQIERIENSLLYDLKKFEASSNTKAEIASTVIQTIKSNSQIIDFINRSEEITTEDILHFNWVTTPYIENIASINPDIRSLRIYCNSDRIPERWPVFISSERVYNEDWYNTVPSEKLFLRLGYREELSAHHATQLSGGDIISYSSALNKKIGKDKSVIELSFQMQDFFGDMYIMDEHRMNYFYKDGTVYTNKDSTYSNMWLGVVNELESKIQFDDSNTKPQLLKTKDAKYLVVMQKSDVFSAHFISIYNIDEVVNNISKSRAILVFALLVFIIVLSLIYDTITRVLLKRIYKTIDAMKKLENGNITVQIANASNDEIGQLQKYFNRMVVKIDDLVKQNIKRSILEKDAQIKALQSQINSHFLYNVLNNIEMMATIEENYLIVDTTTALGRLLRYSMNWKSQMVPIKNEIEYVKDYLQLFNIRFDNPINLTCNIPDYVQKTEIPKMSIQPIVENSIIHGIENMLHEATIYINVFVEEGILNIEVTDSGTGIDADTLKQLNDSIKGILPAQKGQTSGIGLRNVQERIELCFGSQYGIEVASVKGCYTKVKMKIPFGGVPNEEHINC